MVSKAQPVDTSGFYAVEPKRDCPHCTAENIAPKESFKDIHVNDCCADCEHRGENWLCLKPGKTTVRCSRYVNSHMLNFNRANPDCPIVFSFADFSFWCYICDSYVVHPLLDHTEAFYLQKFGADETVKDVLQKSKDSKHDPVIGEEDEKEEEDEEEEEKKEGDAANTVGEGANKAGEGAVEAEEGVKNFLNLDELNAVVNSIANVPETGLYAY